MFIRPRVVAQRCSYQRGGGGQKLGRILREVSRCGAIHLQHAPCRAADQHWNIADGDNAMLRQKLGANELLLFGEISDADRLGRLECAARRRPKVSRERDGADDTLLPADTRNQQ